MIRCKCKAVVSIAKGSRSYITRDSPTELGHYSLTAPSLFALNNKRALEQLDVSFRKTTIEDFKEVADIRKNLYDGIDYLPSLYNDLLCTNTGYAAVVNDKIVGFCLVEFNDGGLTMIKRAGRVHQDYQGAGLIHGLMDFIQEDIRSSDACIKRITAAHINKEGLRDLRKQGMRMVVERESLMFIANRNHLRSPTNINKSSVLNSEQMQTILESEQNHDLFPGQRIVTNFRVPYRLCPSNIKFMFQRYNLHHVTLSNNLQPELLTFGTHCNFPTYNLIDINIYGKALHNLPTHLTSYFDKVIRKSHHDEVKIIAHFHSSDQSAQAVMAVFSGLGFRKHPDYKLNKTFYLELNL